MVTIGSRGSALALVQTYHIKKQINRSFPEMEVAIKIIKTSADKDTTASIRSGTAVGVFVKEIEQALLEGEIDLAVHSMKDLPTRIPAGLRLAAVPEREDVHDVLLFAGPLSLERLPAGARIGTGSLRRQAQILALRPDLKILDIRGNIHTRIRKLEQGMYDAVILAGAGLNRLEIKYRFSEKLSLNRMLPAPGQGALALEIRDQDRRLEKITEALNHWPTFWAITAERSFLHCMGGGCNVPIAAYARVRGDFLQMDALVALPDGSRVLRQTLRCQTHQLDEAIKKFADEMLALGAGEILDRLR